MRNKKNLMFCLISGAFISLTAHAGMSTDAHGNVGYDTAAECDAAVQAGNAKFYQSFTTKPPLRRAGEAKVTQAHLSDLGPAYRLGACDLGVGKQHNRDGVARALQGKYVPFSPNMPINVYSNKTGQPVRASMVACDNNFSGPVPRPVPVPAAQPEPAAVVAPPPAPVETGGIRPYVFGTLGAVRDGISYSADIDDNNVGGHDSAFAGQVGAGLQFNDLIGAEVFYQGADKLHFNADDGSGVSVRNNTYGARMTLGGTVAEGVRLFGKIGVAGVDHSNDALYGGGGTQARVNAGVGFTFSIVDNLLIRADYDHYFKSGSDNPEWKDADYFGAGLQYNF